MLPLPYDGGRVLARSGPLPGREHMSIVLAHFPSRGPPWASDGQYVCWIVTEPHGSREFVSGIYETNLSRALDIFAMRLKHEYQKKEE